MTDTVHIRYDDTTGRIVQRYWGEDAPEKLTDPPEGYAYASEPDFSQASRGQLLREAKAEYEPGADYDPEAETVGARLYYEPDSEEYDGGEIYAAAEVVELSDEQTLDEGR